GAYDEIPETAVTIGMKQIVEARKLIIYFNRPWQSAVCRKALLMEPTPEFPVTLARKHPDIIYIMTELVAARPDFALR
ncbi:MAG: glucosamine-6-phosphate isomerase, partial [Spirochaetia bacterium]|nr:glucosamine-6-phosphate isomerase [Spirochaetia bacterium]